MTVRPSGADEGSPVTGAAEALPGGAERTAATRRLVGIPRGSTTLDRLSALAARLLGCTSAQVSLLSDVQTVAGGHGLPPGAIGGQSPLAASLCTVTAASGGPLAVEDATTDDRVAALPPVAAGTVHSYLGVPLVSDDGHVVGAMCVFDAARRSWSDADVALLQQLAAAAVAELELSALSAAYETGQVVWELALDAAGIGTFDWDLLTGTLHWDERLIELFGYDVEGFDRSIEAFLARLHPDDVPRVRQALDETITSCGEYAGEYRIVRPGGQTRWVTARGRALCDESGRAVRFLGAAYDTTGSREGEVRVTRVLEAMSAAFFSLDPDWRFTYVNAEAERVLGRPRDELLGGEIWALFPAAVGSDFERHYRGAAATGQATAFEAYYPAPLDAWFEVRAWPGPDGLSVSFLDITARRAAQAEVQRAADRAALLAEITAELSGTLDAQEAVGRLARLVVPALADWCIVTLVHDEHSDIHHGLHDIGWWHADPQARPVVERYAGLRLAALTEQSFLARALHQSGPVLVPRGAAAAISDVLVPGEARDLFAALAPESAAVLPLRGRDRTVGLLTLYSGAARAPIAAADLATAREVAGRAGLALDNARLYEQQRELAAGLQRSLLTEPPAPDHLEVVVRYEPAAEAAQVGGDWYDAFLQRDGATVLVIGDVVGHDTAAAAAMGQVRGLLRGIAGHTGDGPADVLCGVDRVMDLLQVATTATAVVARIEQTAQERRRGLAHVRWSNAGHPPPMVLNPDGTVAVLAGVEADVLLGIEPDSRRVESEVALDWGATVLLYTDGLVERRGQSLEDGLALLRDTLVDLGARSLPLQQLCDEVLARLLPPRPDDDVALVAVRLHPQDAPRPAEAGPRRVPPAVPAPR